MPKAEEVKLGSTDSTQSTPIRLTARPWKASASPAPSRPRGPSILCSDRAMALQPPSAIRLRAQNSGGLR